jgi:imidazolonepropionase-like amidohydrolase
MPSPELSRRHLLGAGLAAVAAAALPGGAQAASPLGGWEPAVAGPQVFSNATLVRHTGVKVQGGIVVEGGDIVAMGPEVKGGLDLGGAWLCPGFTDAGCTVGLYEIDQEEATHDDDEGSSAFTPDARAWEGYNPLSAVVPIARSQGVAAVLVHPSMNRLLVGQAGLLRTVGRTVDEALLRAPVGMALNFGRAGISGQGDSPKSRMGVAMELRKRMAAIELPPAKGERPRKGEEVKPDKEVSPADQALRDWKRGKIGSLLRAERADDILMAIDFARSHKLRAALVGCAEGHLVAREIAESGYGVLLGGLMVQPDSFETLHARYDNAALLHEAGVKLAFRSGANHTSRNLRVDAGVTVAHGLPWEVAIRALTAGIGDVLGVPGRYGRLAVGAPATFFVSDGDPLQARSRVTQMWIDGRPVSLRNRQTELFERYRTL